MIIMFGILIALVIVLLLFGTVCVSTVMSAEAQVSSPSDQSQNSGDIKIEVTSSSEVHGVAGQIIRIEGKITNPSTKSSNNSGGGIAYISIVDLADKVPVDLEDWSAEKGLYIPSISAGQSLPLEWNVRLVKAGSYTVDILFNKDSDRGSPPIASSKIFMNVQPKFNLNPENILPVAFGVPAALLAILGSINYHRGRKTGVYR
jgi:hypothetical protein